MLEFSRAGAAIGATSATLEKTRILGAYFRTLSEDDLRRAAVYMSGRAFPPSQRRTLGLGWSTVSKVISSLSSQDEEELGSLFRKHADPGDWAGAALRGHTEPAQVALADVEGTLEDVATLARSLIREITTRPTMSIAEVVAGIAKIVDKAEGAAG